MARVRVGDVHLHVEEGGRGPALLLIAGLPALASDWAPLAARLRAERRVIAYDNRGSGASDVTPGPYTTAQLADDAARLLAALEAAPADVFGMSMGGMVAQELALRHPRAVRRLVLGCTQAATRAALRPPPAAGRAFADETVDWPERIRRLAPNAFAADVDPDLLARFVAKKSGDVQDEIGYRAQIAAVLAHDATARLGEIMQPTLVLTGDDDRIIPAANGHVLAAAIPGARVEVVAGAGHLFFLERPDETVGLLRAFLA